MTAYAYGGPDWVEIVSGFVIDGQSYPPNWPDLASDEERAARGIGLVLAANPLGPGERATGPMVLVDDAGSPRWSVPRGDIPLSELVAAKCTEVDARRDALIAGGFAYGGKTIQSATTDQVNISTLGMIAQFSGATAGDFRWLDLDHDFQFITLDNTTLSLDAPGMVALLEAGVAFKGALTFAAREKKDWLLDPARTRDEVLTFNTTAGW